MIQRNFPFEHYLADRDFDALYFSDQYRQKHLLPTFLSKITPPDSTFIEFDPAQGGSLVRGIRTLGEVAHFVRCIPFKSHENPLIWSSPDFLLTMKVGSIEEHALLMASMFRAVKYETLADIEREFEQKQTLARLKAEDLTLDFSDAGSQGVDLEDLRPGDD